MAFRIISNITVAAYSITIRITQTRNTHNSPLISQYSNICWSPNGLMKQTLTTQYWLQCPCVCEISSWENGPSTPLPTHTKKTHVDKTTSKEVKKLYLIDMIIKWQCLSFQEAGKMFALVYPKLSQIHWCISFS